MCIDVKSGARLQLVASAPRLFYQPNQSLTRKKMTGTNKAGKKLRVLISRSFNREIPEAVIKKPPIMVNSVTSGPLKKEAERNLAIR